MDSLPGRVRQKCFPGDPGSIPGLIAKNRATMKRIFNKAKKASKLEVELDTLFRSIESDLIPLCDFEIFVQSVAGDGIVLGNYVTANVARIHTALTWIEKHGNLSEEEHKSLCI